MSNARLVRIFSEQRTDDEILLDHFEMKCVHRYEPLHMAEYEITPAAPMEVLRNHFPYAKLEWLL